VSCSPGSEGNLLSSLVHSGPVSVRRILLTEQVSGVRIGQEKCGPVELLEVAILHQNIRSRESPSRSDAIHNYGANFLPLRNCCKRERERQRERETERERDRCQ
jgi:hypothetical protein